MKGHEPEHRAAVEVATRFVHRTDDVYVTKWLDVFVRGRWLKRLNGARVILGVALEKRREGAEALEAFFEELRAAKWPAKEVDQVRSIMERHGDDLLRAVADAAERYAAERPQSTAKAGVS